MARPVQLNLTEGDREDLEREAVNTTDKHLATMCRAVLRLGSGQSREEVATRLHVHPVTVSRWASRFRKHGMKGLAGATTARLGRPPKLRREHLDLLSRLAQTPPRQIGKPFLRWTLRRLARCFTQKTNLSIRPHYVGVLLRGMGISWSSPREKSPLGSPEAAVLWFAIATSQQPKAAQEKRRQRATLFVAMNLRNGHVTQSYEEGRAPAVFIQFLEHLLKEHHLQRILLIAEIGSVRITRPLARFLESHAHRLEVIWAVSSASDWRVAAPRRKQAGDRIQYLFNSPEMLVARLRKGIQEIVNGAQ